MKSVVTPRIWFPEAGTNEPVEGQSMRVYGHTRKHPTRPGYVFPAYDADPAALEQWRKDWEAGANRDIFDCRRLYGFPVPVYDTDEAIEPDFKQRVRNEKAALDENNAKLITFTTGGIFAKLPKEEQSRLLRQSDAMTAYSVILGERIAAFDAAPLSELPPAATTEPDAAVEVSIPETAPLTRDLAAEIRAKLSERNYRLKELAESFHVEQDELRAFIEAKGSGFYLAASNWVKEGTA